MSFLLLVYAYILGGVTFLPLLLAAFIYLHPKKSPSHEPESLKAGEIEESTQTGLSAFKQGWITVTHEYMESTDNILSSTQSVSESSEGKSAYASLYKLVKNSNPKQGKTGSSSSSVDTTDTQESPMATGGSGSAGNNGTKPGNKKHRYFAVLKHGNLFLYKNERLKDVKHVVVLSKHIVTLWPRTLTEGSLFTKNSSIAILKKDWSRTRRLSDNFGDSTDLAWTEDKKITIEDVMQPKNDLPAPPGSFFIYTDINIEKEDWYFALIRATKADSDSSLRLDPERFAKTLHFETRNMVDLISTLYSSEGQVQTKWLNALMGRLFLSLQKTDVMRDYLVSRIEKKLNKLKTPGFLDKFQITKVNAGHGAPFITFPVLKEISPEGDLLISLYMQYKGGMSIQLATKLNLNLGTRLSRDMDVLLSMTLDKIQGPMLLKIKAPPSARLWYTFESEPIMSVNIQPIISSRQMSYTIITNSIEKKLKEAVKESVVLPHWDDFIFYNTENEVYRGGVWDKDARTDIDTETKTDTEEVPTDAQSEKDSLASCPNDDTLTVASVDDAALTISKSDSISLTDSAPSKSQRTKLATTLGDFSKRLRKTKTGHTLSVDETNCLSDGTTIDNVSMKLPIKDDQENSVSSAESKSGALRKLGSWYYSDVKPSEPTVLTPPVYNPPEMITNRRQRKQSSATLSSDPQRMSEGPSYDFGASATEPNLMARSIDKNAELLHTPEPALPVIKPTAVSVTSVPQSLSSQTVSEGVGSPQENELLQSLHRSDTALHRKPPPPGPVPAFPPENSTGS